MKLNNLNNLLLLIVIFILSKIGYNIFKNKKTIETFKSGIWKLNNLGQLCNGTTCKKILLEGDDSDGGIGTVVDCELGSWTDWGSCESNTGSCGTGAGSQSQSREILKEAINGGNVCGSLTQYQLCDLDACPPASDSEVGTVVDCELGSWTDWGSCESNTGSCGAGAGIKTQTRTITREASNGGDCAWASMTQTQSCDLDACPPASDSEVGTVVDCELGSWTDWGSCESNTGSCGTGAGSQSQSREILKEAINGGNVCGSLTQYQLCDLDACPPASDPEVGTGVDALIYSPDHPDHNGKQYFIFNNTTKMLRVTPNMTISSIGLFSTVPLYTPIVTDNMKVSTSFNNYYASIIGSGVTDSDIIDFNDMTNQITTTDTEFILISSDNFDYRINIVDGIVKSIVDYY